MRLVTVQLMAPIKAPWDNQYTEMLAARPGWEYELRGNWLHILRDSATVLIVNGALVRTGMVDVRPVVQPVELHVSNPDHLKVIEQLATVQPKRRGREGKTQ